MGFTCSVCGEYHEERPLDIRYDLPDPVFALSDRERDARAMVAEDFCRLTEADGQSRHYVRGLLEIPITDVASEFGYGVWVEVEETDFLALSETWHDPDERTLISGRLANELEAYPGSLGLQVSVRNRRQLPEVLIGEPHPLGDDQRAGVDDVRADELSASILHC